ncbi:hypothetical protein QP71_00160, partial [Staphylococcus aureus]
LAPAFRLEVGYESSCFAATDGGSTGRARAPRAERRARGRARRTSSVAAHQADEAALDTHPVGAEHTGLVGGVRRLEGDRGTAAAQALQGRLLVVDQCHDDVAGVGGVLLADHHEVAVEDASLDHRVAAHLQGIVLAARDHV